MRALPPPGRVRRDIRHTRVLEWRWGLRRGARPRKNKQQTKSKHQAPRLSICFPHGRAAASGRGYILFRQANPKFFSSGREFKRSMWLGGLALHGHGQNTKALKPHPARHRRRLQKTVRTYRRKTGLLPDRMRMIRFPPNFFDWGFLWGGGVKKPPEHVFCE